MTQMRLMFCSVGQDTLGGQAAEPLSTYSGLALAAKLEAMLGTNMYVFSLYILVTGNNNIAGIKRCYLIKN